MATLPSIEEITEIVNTERSAPPVKIDLFSLLQRSYAVRDYNPNYLHIWSELVAVHNRLESQKTPLPKGSILTKPWIDALDFMASGQFIYALCVSRPNDRANVKLLLEYFYRFDKNFVDTPPATDPILFVIAHLFQNKEAFSQSSVRLKSRADPPGNSNSKSKSSGPTLMDYDPNQKTMLLLEDPDQSDDDVIETPNESGEFRLKPVGNISTWKFYVKRAKLDAEKSHLEEIVNRTNGNLTSEGLSRLTQGNLTYTILEDILNTAQKAEQRMREIVNALTVSSPQLRSEYVESGFNPLTFLYDTVLPRINEIVSDCERFSWPPQFSAHSSIASAFSTAMTYLNRTFTSMGRPTIPIEDVPSLSREHWQAIVRLFEVVMTFHQIDTKSRFSPSSRSLYVRSIVGMSLSTAKLIALNK